MKKQNLFIDTDMGNDDIMAIAYLLLKRQFKIIGISTVNGVATKENGVRNLNSLLNFLDVSFPICLGSTKAIKEKNACFPQYDTQRANRLTLLKKLPIKQSKSPGITIPIENFIFEKTKNQKAIILALGPLTNIAKTIQKYGDAFTSQIQIFMMGGGIKRGNVPPTFAAEYNIFLDPEAAQTVFESKIPITMVGIDATDAVPATNEFSEKVRKTSVKSKEAQILKEIIISNNGDFSSFYDPLSVFLLSTPSAINKETQTGISVVLVGDERGKTIFDSSRANVNVVMSVNAKAFYKKVLYLLERS